MLRDLAARNYRLIDHGERNDAFRHAFHAVTLTRIGANTALAGDVRDQAEPHGLFRRVSHLGLTLLEARAIEDRPDKLPENRSADADKAENRSRGSGSYKQGADAGYDNQRNGNTPHGI
jgi:hypothetical protein